VKIKVRKAIADEHALVYDAWLRHLASSAGLPFARVEVGGRRVIDRILRRPGTEVRLAVDAEDRERILGLVVLDVHARLLHFAYTKREAQQFGICRTLLAGLPPLRVWWMSKGARHVARCAEISYDPLALVEV
jgi:hypothetical protein